MTTTQIDLEDLIAAVAAKRAPSLPAAELDALVASHAEARLQRRRDIEDRLAAKRPIPSGLAEALLRGRQQPATTVRSMSDVARRAYNREKAALSRARRKSMSEAGTTPVSPSTVREGLADAAISLIRAGGPAAQAVLAELARAFPHAPGVPLTTRSDIAAGRLREKLPK
ncbi:MAG: hypothetical protein ACT6QU_14665 [Aliihoeflea sp.]|uniref:hypothetical protein n=1 Tax=Aliihoeflea sp. TaxID=2608088 RepID=UPI004033C176